jgi:uncharacterized protein (TIGR03067 family)
MKLAADQPPASSNPANGSTAPSAQAQKGPSDDSKRIQGHWVCVQGTEDGKAIPNGGGGRAVFTEKEVKLGGTAFTYRLDPTSNPKHCLLEITQVGVPFHAVYSLKDDTLTLVMPKSSGAAYPNDMKPAQGRDTYVFRRADKSGGAKDAAASKAPSLKDLEATKSLRKDLAEAIRLLNEEKYQEFYERISTPEDRKAMEQRKGAMEDMLSVMKERGPKMAKLLGIVSELQPTFDESKTRATYDLRAVHVDGVPGHSSMRFVKIGDHWRIKEDR